MTRYAKLLILLVGIICLSACSTTKHVPDGDQLFTGLTKIEYKNYVDDENFIATQEEVEAALATAPNGALFGSSYYRTPFPYGLWIWNYAYGSSGKIKKWLNKSFGKAPVLMSQVNPALRASVAQSVLRKNGYMHGQVSYEEKRQRNPKKMKIGYTVTLDTLFTIDTLSYVNFPPQMQALIDSTQNEAQARKGDPFNVATLDAERTRLSQLFRNNGYYYYQSGYASYLADTFDVRNRAKLRLQLADSLPEQALHPWYVGNIRMQLRESSRQQMTDSIGRRFLKIFYGTGKKHAPISPRVILRDLKLRPRRLFSYADYSESIQKINGTGVFSSVDLQFTPRDRDTLDLTLNCTFDKPWDVYLETNFVNRTIGRMGPEIKLGFTRRNAFRGGEKLDVNLHGSYEWQTSSQESNMSTYQYGADASIEFPRIIAPFFGGNRIRRDKQGRPIRRRRFYTTPSTIAKVSTDIIHRPEYYKMHVNSGEWTYQWQTSAQSRHEFSPLTVKYQFMNSHTDAFDTLVYYNPYLAVTMQDYFIPEMRYTYTYTSPAAKLNPIRWETTLSEAGNVVSLCYLLKGNDWNEKDKKLFKNPYSQFLKLETDFTKTWRLNSTSTLVGHINAGYIWMYGNSDWVPNSEMFYVGGANSIRAFSVRGVGPGAVQSFGQHAFDYLFRNGTIKFVWNLEYRTQLFGNLSGALFLDAGNVWMPSDDHYDDPDMERIFSPGNFHLSNFFREQALGTGLGLRYDLSFLIIRLDWGLALHLPYDTGKSGYFNIDGFKGNNTLHFAIGYPF